MAESKPSSEPYTVLARRYRPQQFEECIGQEHVAQSLRNAIQTGRVAHAYLFTGSRGIGKTSMARILAKALDCQQGPTPRPCGECEICRSIATGEDVDVIEVDGASNRGIDEIREIRQSVNYRPSRARYKIYIIDEVHMLTKEAFNALLKTLEEPPGHVKFIFATTEPQKIPVTILSRCQRFDFAGIDQSRIAARLKEIVEFEGMAADEEALELIARRVGGSMRDGQSLLDQLLAFCTERLTVENIHQVLGTAGEEQVIGLTSAIFEGDAARCLELVESAAAEGVQLGEWVAQMLEYFRDLMVLGIHPKAELVSMSNRRRDSILEQSKNLSPERLLEMMDLLAACRDRMRISTHGRTLLEMTLVRLCRLDNFLNLAEAMVRGPSVGSQSNPAGSVPASGARSARGKISSTQIHHSDAVLTGPAAARTRSPVAVGKASGANSSAVPSEEGTSTNAAEANVALSAETLTEFWSTVKERLDDMFLVNMIETASQVLYRQPGTVVVQLGKTAKLHCEEHSRTARIEEVCTKLAGRAVLVRFEESVGGESNSSLRERTSPARLRELAAKDPMVRRAEEVLGAKMLKVDQVPVKKPSGEAQAKVDTENG